MSAATSEGKLMTRRPMPISSRWFQGAVLTYLLGFTVLGILAYLVYRDQPPIPGKVVTDGKVLFTRDDVFAGMNVFQRYGLMQYGSVYGHGAYLGPDFTTEYLHRSAELLVQAYEGAPPGELPPGNGLQGSCTRTPTMRGRIH